MRVQCTLVHTEYVYNVHACVHCIHTCVLDAIRIQARLCVGLIIGPYIIQDQYQINYDVSIKTLLRKPRGTKLNQGKKVHV